MSEQGIQKINFTEAIRSAVMAKCETHAAIKSHVQAKTGFVPSGSLISRVLAQISGVKRKRGRPAGSKNKAKTGKPKFENCTFGTSLNENRSPVKKPCVNFIPMSDLKGVSAIELVGIAKLLSPYVKIYGVDKVKAVVSHAIGL